MIPVILKGETSKPIQLTLREGYVYSGCVLAVCFRGVMKTFTDLVAGGTVELLYTAEETSTFPLGTGKVGLSIQNSAGDICFMPWAKIKVTDSPAEVHDAQITIDPATLNVSDATSKDSLGAVKSKLNAVLAFLRGLSSLAVLALPLYALSDVAPLYSAFEDIPGDEQVVTNVVPYVEAKVTAATNAIPRADLAPATNYTDAVATEFENGSRTVANANGSLVAVRAEIADEAMSATWAARISDGGRVGADNLTYADILGGFVASTNYTDAVALELANGDRSVAHADHATNATYADYWNGLQDWWDFEYRVVANDATNAAVAVADAKISTNNAAFVSAVLAVPLTGADAGDLAEIAEYGGYGTVGAAILALIAGLAALKRGKADKAELPYDIVQATPSNGVVTVGPRTIATYTAGTSAAAFTVAVGTGETGKARDCELVIDCTATGAVAPTVTWPSNFHPRTDAATDFACEAGVRNVYFISEFSSGEFAVGGWQETTGGNGT